ncbi:hypothetical protein CDAR_572251 [Caerostris darwini]|uniref:LAGLIDADG homing endonuclease n=1 Tax=Caerostris darwini TaxID=1538125 RepID=A0AAV4PGU4_9ARAC|nr:hypothetical protein CDAR_572251 [Caerostris darwini]
MKFPNGSPKSNLFGMPSWHARNNKNARGPCRPLGPTGERSGSFPGVFTCENSQLAFKKALRNLFGIAKRTIPPVRSKEILFSSTTRKLTNIREQQKTSPNSFQLEARFQKLRLHHCYHQGY